MLHAEVASVSQTERLRGAMATSTVTHGQTVRADISHVKVSSQVLSKPLVYFCHMHEFTVRETVRPGDGGALPSEVAVSGLAVPREGFYDIKNALVSSNGRINVAIDESARVVPARQSLMTMLLNTQAP